MVPNNLEQSPEQRVANLAKARATVAGLKATAGELKTDWLDDEVWQDIAKERGVRLPAPWQRIDDRSHRKALRAVGMNVQEFLEWGGYAELSDFARLNPRWPLRALYVVLLEYAAERDDCRKGLADKLRADTA